MNTFTIPNARVTWVTQRPKVSYLTLLAASARQGMTSYFDVVVFATQGLTVPAEGASVSVTGTLGRRKPQSGTVWTTELIARSLEAGDEGLTPVVGPRRAEPAMSSSENCPCGDSGRPGHPIGQWCDGGIRRNETKAADLKAAEDDSLIPF